MSGGLVLVTGLPHAVAVGYVRRLLQQCPEVRVLGIVRADLLERAEREISRGMPGWALRVTLRPGTVTTEQLGQESRELAAWCDEIVEVVHIASLYHLGSDKALVEAVNIGGTQHLLSIAGRCPRLRRFHHYSTCFVAGDRAGVVLEEELERGQGFRNTWERTRFAAEMLVRRRAGDLPITISRAGILVGDSRTGELGRTDGPQFLLNALVHEPGRLRLPSGSWSDRAVAFAPVDYVASAMLALGREEAAEGRTFHLVDPDPLSLASVVSLVDEIVGRMAALQARRRGWFDRLLDAAWLHPLAAAGRLRVDELDTRARFNTMEAARLLQPLGLRCPAVPDYVETLVRAARDGSIGWARTSSADQL